MKLMMFIQNILKGPPNAMHSSFFLSEKADKLRTRGASSTEYDYFAQEIEDLVGSRNQYSGASVGAARGMDQLWLHG
jgi:hypothetical protein